MIYLSLQNNKFKVSTSCTLNQQNNMEQNIAFNIFNDVDNGCDNNNNPSLPSIWIFGYGSLCYNPGFEYEKCVTGYVRGYLRRFWQGNVTHRGTVEQVSF